MVDKRQDEPRTARVEITAAHPVPPSEGANYFHFTSVGAEIQMLVGTVNLLRLHESMLGEGGTVSPEITHRFLLSPLGFAHLKQQIEEIAQSVAPPQVAIEGRKK
jgi:hypothetical protein